MTFALPEGTPIKVNDLKLTETEKEFIKCPETQQWIFEFYNFTVNRISISTDYQNKLGNFPTCMVASVRKKFGLSEYYKRPIVASEKYATGKDLQECEICSNFAHFFYNVMDNGDMEPITRKEYTRKLGSFRRHIRYDHKDGKVRLGFKTI